MHLGSTFPVFVALAAVLSSLLLSLLQRYVLRPWLMVRRLRAQGIPGYPFRAVVGNLPELFSLEAARNKDPALAANTRASQMLFEGTRKLGRVWYWTSGSMPRVVIADPALIRQAFISKTHNFVKPAVLKQLRLLRNGLLVLEGKEWARHRRLLTPAFHFPELRRLFSSMALRTHEALADWEQATPGVPLLMDEELSSLALRIISSTAFGMGFSSARDGRIKEVQEAFGLSLKIAAENRVMSTALPFYPDLPTPNNRRMWAAEDVMQRHLRSIVAERLRLNREGGRNIPGGKGGGRVDLLQMMLESTEGMSEDKGAASEKVADGGCKGALQSAASGAPYTGAGNAHPATTQCCMTEQQLIDECMTFLGAGHETTATLLTWTMVLLSQHQDWQERARQEVVELLKATQKEGGSLEDWTPDFDSVNALKTVTCVLQEMLRMYPPVAFLTRTCAVDTALSETLTVPAGCDILAPIEVVHYSPEFWGSDVDEFNPDRFAEGAGKATTEPGAYIPFGLGPRVCIGQNFALVEAKLILSLMLLRFKWATAASYRHHPTLVLTMKPKHGVPILLTKV